MEWVRYIISLRDKIMKSNPVELALLVCLGLVFGLGCLLCLAGIKGYGYVCFVVILLILIPIKVMKKLMTVCVMALVLGSCDSNPSPRAKNYKVYNKVDEDSRPYRLYIDTIQSHEYLTTVSKYNSEDPSTIHSASCWCYGEKDN